MLIGCCALALACMVHYGSSLPVNKSAAREQVVEMFYHAYNAYMKHAWPADELMPLSCKGRYRGVAPDRGDIDDALGNYSLTLIDTLDTLVVLGDFVEFEKAVALVTETVHFDHDLIVSVFEANIRVVGGLLSAHILALEVQRKAGGLTWYKDNLLHMARDLAIRLLPAFNTSTGLPHPRVNLRYGLTRWLRQQHDTCTACAGSMIMEFAALSRLTGDSIFEDKAKKAMDFLWKQRHRGSDLMGTILNIHSGDWIRRDSGVGAGIDSYYEYCLKTYILLGDENYLRRFNRHYAGVMRYVSQGPLLVDVHMHRPDVTSRSFMDSLLAFWPGLQVLKGDLKPAIETHEMLYQVIQRHSFLPEAFTHDFQMHWSEHHLRPEFLESTYFLYRATSDPHYLEVGKEIMDSLDKYARVDCGFAAVKDLRSMAHEDRLDSFVFAETFKYLYLLFAEPDDVPINPDDFVFTTEAHFLPLNLAGTNPKQERMDPIQFRVNDIEESNAAASCPNDKAELFAMARTLRQNVRNSVLRRSPMPNQKAKLKAHEFNAGNPKHIELLSQMGIQIVNMPDGRVQLVQSAQTAASPDDAQNGLVFLKDMIELSKQQPADPIVQQATRVVQVLSKPHFGRLMYQAFPAQFGVNLEGKEVVGNLAMARPYRACLPISNAPDIAGRIVLVQRSDCMFVEKARRLEDAGAIGMIVVDHFHGTSAEGSPGFAMSGDGITKPNIPALFLFQQEGDRLRAELYRHKDVKVRLAESTLNPNGLVPHLLKYPRFFGLRPATVKSCATAKSPTDTGTRPPSVVDETWQHSSAEQPARTGDNPEKQPSCQRFHNRISASTKSPVLDIESSKTIKHLLRFKFDKFHSLLGGLETPAEDLDEDEKSQIADVFLTSLLTDTNLDALPHQSDYVRVLKKLMYLALGESLPISKSDEHLLSELAHTIKIDPKAATASHGGRPSSAAIDQSEKTMEDSSAGGVTPQTDAITELLVSALLNSGGVSDSSGATVQGQCAKRSLWDVIRAPTPFNGG